MHANAEHSAGNSKYTDLKVADDVGVLQPGKRRHFPHEPGVCDRRGAWHADLLHRVLAPVQAIHGCHHEAITAFAQRAQLLQQLTGFISHIQYSKGAEARLASLATSRLGARTSRLQRSGRLKLLPLLVSMAQSIVVACVWTARFKHGRTWKSVSYLDMP